MAIQVRNRAMLLPKVAGRASALGRILLRCVAMTLAQLMLLVQCWKTWCHVCSQTIAPHSHAVEAYRHTPFAPCSGRCGDSEHNNVFQCPLTVMDAVNLGKRTLIATALGRKRILVQFVLLYTASSHDGLHIRRVFFRGLLCRIEYAATVAARPSAGRKCTVSQDTSARGKLVAHCAVTNSAGCKQAYPTPTKQSLVPNISVQKFRKAQ